MIFYLQLIIYLFFFKPKTAYELRISDWSSDVCSSDLGPVVPVPAVLREERRCTRHAPRVELVPWPRRAGRRLARPRTLDAIRGRYSRPQLCARQPADRA